MGVNKKEGISARAGIPDLMPRSKSSKQWLKDHFSDPFVLKAQAEGLRSRAAYKIKDIQEKYRLIKPGMVVVDLGAAPGGWSEVVKTWVGRPGSVIALDILAMPAIDRVHFIQGDFQEPETLAALHTFLAGRTVDVVLSDMSPNLSGTRSVDQPRAIYLCELALEFAVTQKTKVFIAKLFQGEGFDAYLKALRSAFTKVDIYKPKASRSCSREVYAVARR